MDKVSRRTILARSFDSVDVFILRMYKVSKMKRLWTIMSRVPYKDKLAIKIIATTFIYGWVVQAYRVDWRLSPCVSRG